MKHRLRTIVFWIHLPAGLLAGLIVAVMSATGMALAFQPQILEWAERDGRAITPPAAGAARLGMDELVARYRAAMPGPPPTALTFHADPASAVRVGAGRGGAHVNPYTGEVRPLGGQTWRAFFQVMIEWHRYLGATGEGRDLGKAITGACNAAFLFLALSGLYLWWPRRWSERALRLSFWFRRGLRGKARDWNWHNVIGFWSLPVLIAVTFSGMMISYRWVTTLIYASVGETAPAGPAGAAAPVKVPPPPPGARALGPDALLAATAAQIPTWKSATLRLPGGERGRGGAGASATAGAGAGAGGNPAERGRSGRGGPQPVTLAVKEEGQWPLFGAAQLSLDPFTGKVLRREVYADYTPGRKIRTWLRFLHTGEALGWPGQLLAGLVSLGATLLVWTGFALAWRRFFRRRQSVPRALPDVMPAAERESTAA
jgi:uncharacterized iron-regulated membrane protein